MEPNELILTQFNEFTAFLAANGVMERASLAIGPHTPIPNYIPRWMATYRDGQVREVRIDISLQLIANTEDSDALVVKELFGLPQVLYPNWYKFQNPTVPRPPAISPLGKEFEEGKFALMTGLGPGELFHDRNGDVYVVVSPSPFSRWLAKVK